MSNVNLQIDNSEVIRQNLVILGNSRVENGNLILEKGDDYVIRFSPKIMKKNETMQALYETQRNEIESLHSEIKNNINNTFFNI